MNFKHYVFIHIILALFIGSGCNKRSDETIWKETIDYSRPIKQILQCSVMQRLKGVDQAGPCAYIGPKIPHFSRYEHSVGVYALLKKFKVSEKEQIAGLLHDASHTVFSHVGDYIWTQNISEFTESSYQDSIHTKFMKEHKMDLLLKQFGMTLKDIELDNSNNLALDQALPDMCADRIQYNIHTGVLLKRISKEEAKDMINDLEFRSKKWFFKDQRLAIKFAELSLFFTQNFWGAAWNTSMNIHFANALKQAIKIGLLSEKDMFSTDKEILKKISESNDEVIKLNLKQCNEPLKKIPDQKYTSQFFKPKFRGIDPLVLKDGKLHRLTSLDMMFKNYYEATKAWCKQGFTMDILEVE